MRDRDSGFARKNGVTVTRGPRRVDEFTNARAPPAAGPILRACSGEPWARRCMRRRAHRPARA